MIDLTFSSVEFDRLVAKALDSDIRPSTCNRFSIEARWYESLDKHLPDYGIYDTPEYLAEAFHCWKTYSRSYLRAIQTNQLMLGGVHAMPTPKIVIDLGCGVGLTSVLLSKIFPEAWIVATNIVGSMQWHVAETLFEDYERIVLVANEQLEPADFVFASEYFEHFAYPLSHLLDVVTRVQPATMIIANAFGGVATGHFREYEGGIPNHQIGRQFNAMLRRLSYRQVETRFWNQRPAFWRREQER